MKNLKNITKRFIEDESGQGATEYILLLVVIVGLVVMFGPRIRGAVEDRLGNLEGLMGQVTGGN